MALSDIFQVVLSGLLGSIPYANVFFYARVNGSGGAGGLGANFDTVLITQLATWQDSVMSFDNVAVKNLGTPTDFANITPTTPDGDLTVLTANKLPKFGALGFKMPTPTGAIRNGYKRFPVLTDEAINGSGLDATWANYQDILDTADALSTTLTDGVTTDYDPIILKRIKVDNGDGTYSYRLPETDGEVSYYTADGWEWANVTTQNSRKG